MLKLCQSQKKLFLDSHASKVLARYWGLYGGWEALRKSVYIRLAILITIICFPLWSLTGSDGLRWPGIVLSVIPSMLGFSMGGMAIALAFSSSDAFNALAEDGDKKSTYLIVIGNFFHFILVQTIAIVLAIISIAIPNILFSIMGIFIFFYAVLTGVAMAGQLLRVSEIFNAVAGVRARQKQNKQDN